MVIIYLHERQSVKVRPGWRILKPEVDAFTRLEQLQRSARLCGRIIVDNRENKQI